MPVERWDYNNTLLLRLMVIFKSLCRSHAGKHMQWLLWLEFLGFNKNSYLVLNKLYYGDLGLVYIKWSVCDIFLDGLIWTLT